MNVTTTAIQVTLSNAEIAILHTWYWSIRTGMCSVAARVPNVTGLKAEECQAIVDGLVAKGMMERKGITYGLVINNYYRATAAHRRMWEAEYLEALADFTVNNLQNRKDWWDFTLVVTLAV